MIAASLWMGDFESPAVASVLLEVGAAIALLAAFVVVEPRLMRQVASVAESAAVEAVDRSTAGLRERVVKLEDLDRAQQEERIARQRERDGEIDRLLTGALSPASVGELLAAAHDEKLLDDRRFHVRTSQEPSAHVLFMLPLRAENGVRVMWLDFEAIEDSALVDQEFGFALPKKGEATVVWINSEPASQIAADLEAGLQRLNRPLHGFSFAHALEQLAESVRIMRRARSSEPESPHRLEGRLRFLINGRWAYTSYGLEALQGTARFSITDAGFRGGPPAATFWPGCINSCERPEDEPEAEWREAVWWLAEREGFEVLAPGQTQDHPLTRVRK